MTTEYQSGMVKATASPAGPGWFFGSETHWLQPDCPVLPLFITIGGAEPGVTPYPGNSHFIQTSGIQLMEILLFIAIAILVFLNIGIRGDRGKHRRRTRTKGRYPGNSEKPAGTTVEGKAFVTDGDGIKVLGKRVRIADIDAPELDQLARLWNGKWVNEGRQAKRALFEKVGGKPVCVVVEGHDQYGRILGIVTHDGEDVGRWLVEAGLAISSHGARYRNAEISARAAKRGRWRYAQVFSPYDWRRGTTEIQSKPPVYHPDKDIGLPDSMADKETADQSGTQGQATGSKAQWSKIQAFHAVAKVNFVSARHKDAKDKGGEHYPIRNIRMDSGAERDWERSVQPDEETKSRPRFRWGLWAALFLAISATVLFVAI